MLILNSLNFPLAKKINPNIVDSLNSLSKVAIDESNIVDEYLAIIKSKISLHGSPLTREKYFGPGTDRQDEEGNG